LMPANELFVTVVAESHAVMLPHLGRCETAEGVRGAYTWAGGGTAAVGAPVDGAGSARGCAWRRWQREARGCPGQTGRGRGLRHRRAPFISPCHVHGRLKIIWVAQLDVDPDMVRETADE
jgi:hypothetical protein